ncbi:MAG: ribonuclease J [Janthinobacterium lividum]
MSKTNTRSELSQDLFFLPLGGAGEIGMNLNLYSYQDHWLMVDLGVTFGKDLGIEIMMPDPSYIVERRDRLKGLVITHAHEDHIGAIPYLWEKLQCPIYATPFTATLIRDKLKKVGLAQKAKVHEIDLGGKVSLDPFEVQFLSLTHSIPEPNALAIRTPSGIVVHTGDWKIDPNPLIGEKVDENVLKALGDEGVLALVCDSTNVFVEENAGSESTVREKLIEFVSRPHFGRVIIACFASNVARLESCALAAQQAGRKAILMGRSMIRMDQAARDNGYLKNIPAFLTDEDAGRVKREETVIICTGSQGEPRAALARLASGDHPHLKLSAGDTVLFSSRMIPGNEDAIRDMQEELIEAGLNVVGAEDIEGIHVSGHPGRPDLKKMYEWIRPQILIPVHGETMHMREQARLGHECGIPHAIVPFNGSLIKLSKEEPEIVDTMPNGRLALDGTKVVPLFSNQMRDRARLMTSGVIFVSLSYDMKRGHLRGTPVVTQVGVFEPDIVDEMIENLQDVVTEALTNTLREIQFTEIAVKEVISIACRRYVNSVRGKKPMVVVHFIS